MEQAGMAVAIAPWIVRIHQQLGGFAFIRRWSRAGAEYV
jgi:hypothetical protein